MLKKVTYPNTHLNGSTGPYHASESAPPKHQITDYN